MKFYLKNIFQKATIIYKRFVLLLLLFTGFSSQLHAQTLIISSIGETGTSGTNWSTSGSSPVIIQATGDANINVSVIAGYLNDGISVTVVSGTDIRLSDAVNKSGGSAATLLFNAGRDIFVQSSITCSSNTLSLDFNADTDVDNIGAITISSTLTTNGGVLTFEDGVTFNGTSVQNISTGAGSLAFDGEVTLSNTFGISIVTSNANVTFFGAINSGNSYSLDATVSTWAQAYTNHNTSTSYLATVASRMELAAVMAVVPSGGAWLGGSDQEIEGVWKWVTGPDAGTIFWSSGQNAVGASGYVGYNESYVNWNEGEPNDSGDDEDALQIRNNTDGKWNDLSTTSGTLAAVVETELSPSALMISAGTGTVTFNGPVGTGKPLRSLNVTAANTAINGGGIITESESAEGGQSYSGNITLGSASTILSMLDTPSDFTLNSDKIISNGTGADATLTIKASASIVFETNSSISSSNGKLNTILWANADANGGYFNMLSGSSIVTNGGHLWIGGGSGSESWNGLTVGNDYAINASATGISLNSPTLNTGIGNIYMAGKSTSSSSSSYGIFLSGGTLSTTTGTISLDGYGGNATGTAANCDGIRIDGTMQSTSGAILLTGYSLAENQSEGIALESNGLLSSTTGNLSLLADILYCTSDARIGSGGTLMLHPTTVTAPIGIAGATGTLSLPATYFSTNFIDGFSQITIGGSSQSGNVNLNSVNFRDNMRLQTSGTVSINANQTVIVPNTVKMQIDNAMQFGSGGKIVVNNPE